MRMLSDRQLPNRQPARTVSMPLSIERSRSDENCSLCLIRQLGSSLYRRSLLLAHTTMRTPSVRPSDSVGITRRPISLLMKEAECFRSVDAVPSLEEFYLHAIDHPESDGDHY